MKAKFEKEWLQNELKTKTLYQICRETETSFSVINRLIRIYGIERKPMLKDVLTYEVLYSLFVEQHLTDAQISQRYHCSIETVKKLRAKYNITNESRTDRLPVPSLEYFKRLYIDYGFSRAQMMKLLGYSVVQFNKLLHKYSSKDGEIKTKRPYHAFQKLIDLMLERVSALVLYGQLEVHTLAEVAEMYEVIPKALPNIETFSPEWAEEILKHKSTEQVLREYHIGRAFFNSIKTNKR